MQYSHETEMDEVCAEFVSVSSLASGIFFRALIQKLLNQTTNSGIIVPKEVQQSPYCMPGEVVTSVACEQHARTRS